MCSIETFIYQNYLLLEFLGAASENNRAEMRPLFNGKDHSMSERKSTGLDPESELLPGAVSDNNCADDIYGSRSGGGAVDPEGWDQADIQYDICCKYRNFEYGMSDRLACLNEYHLHR